LPRFLAQVDLAAFQHATRLDWLPESRRLFFFVDEDGGGFADHVVVRFSPSAEGSAEPVAMSRPFPERRVAFEVYTSLPSLDWLEDDSQLKSDELDELSELPDLPFGDELQHRIGGYPSEIQGGRMHVAGELVRRGLPEDTEITPAIERAAREWRLLLQVDSDPALKMNWGDGGRLYVFVRAKDAVAGDFSKTVTISQSY
jgi:uncharacterized protein YwqG